jgi:hypothetical protein
MPNFLHFFLGVANFGSHVSRLTSYEGSSGRDDDQGSGNDRSACQALSEAGISCGEGCAHPRLFATVLVALLVWVEQRLHQRLEPPQNSPCEG